MVLKKGYETLFFSLILATNVIIITSCEADASLRIMTYNVRNLFDDIDNGTEYDRYDPEKGHWTHEDFEQKLKAIADVIKRSFPEGPDIVALQEVENRYTLDALCERYLRENEYLYRVFIPVKGQPHHCALLSRYPIKRVGSLNPGIWNGQYQRAILEAEFEYEGKTLYIFNNHWKSTIDGASTTEPARLLASKQLSRRIRTILKNDPMADIIILGDFNENLLVYEERGRKYQTALIPDDLYRSDTLVDLDIPGDMDGIDKKEEFSIYCSIFLSGDSDKIGLKGERVIVYDTWYEIPGDQRGSYVYRNKWYTPDHILLSPGLFDLKGFSYEKTNFRIMLFSFLIDPETGFPGKENYNTWSYSDHLPLLITIRFLKDSSGR